MEPLFVEHPEEIPALPIEDPPLPEPDEPNPYDDPEPEPTDSQRVFALLHPAGTFSEEGRR